MKTMRCPDAALIAIAQEIAACLRSDPSRTFQELLADLERSPWPGLAITTAQRKSLRTMTIALSKQQTATDSEAHAVTSIQTKDSVNDRLVA